jgi:hypothetical protein
MSTTSCVIHAFILSILAWLKKSCCLYQDSTGSLALPLLHLRHAGIKLLRLLEPDLKRGTM